MKKNRSHTASTSTFMTECQKKNVEHDPVTYMLVILFITLDLTCTEILHLCDILLLCKYTADD